MRRLAWSVVIGMAAALTPWAHAGAPSDVRTVQTQYSVAGGVAAPPATSAAMLISPGPWVSGRANENQFRVLVHDQSGPVLVEIDYTKPGQTQSTQVLTCAPGGWTSLGAGTSVRVTPLVGRCDDGHVSTPMGGTIDVQFQRTHVASPAQRWAVIIGIQAYGGSTHPTYGGDGDADAVRSSLLHSGWLPSHILDVRDSAATADGILRAMDWLVAHSGPDTFTLLHYSGHVCIDSRGPCASGHTYLWSYDNRFLSETTVRDSLSRLRGHAWIDIAGCEAGAFGPGLSSPLRLFTGSSQPAHTSYEEQSWHESVWTGTTWDQGYIHGLGANGVPYRATIAQMIAYGVSATVRDTTGQARGTQHPYIAGAGGAPGWRLSAPPGG